MLKNGIKSKWNVHLVDGENEICFNESNMKDEIINESFQTIQSTINRKALKRKWKRNNWNKPSKFACLDKNMEMA